MILFEYPKCSTCIKTKKWLDDNGIKYIDRDIKLNNPNVEELKLIHKLSNLPLKRLFNTSGLIYKELNLSEKLENMSEVEQFNLLSSNGMLVKRPILLGDDFALIGFKEDVWKEKLTK